MSTWSRIANAFRGDRVIDDIDEELQSHIEEAIERGRDPNEARRAFGSVLRRREDSRDLRLMPWLDALRADAVIGWRQLTKQKVTTAAAILTLGIAIAACLNAFRLVDALLLRPLPIAEPDRLYVLARRDVEADGTLRRADDFQYPLFRRLRAAVDQAELIAISYVERMDVSVDSAAEIERVHLQYVSGSMFSSFGLAPVTGRLLTANDDRDPQAHPYAVLSYDYWTRRFGQDLNVIGRPLRIGNQPYEIVGVVDQRFTGTEPGTMTDIFLPAMMHAGVKRADWSWLRTFVRLKDNVAVESVEEKLRATLRAYSQELAKQFAGRSRQTVDRFLDLTLWLEPAPAGVSAMQADYARPLAALGTVVALVLLIACANIANLLTARAAARSREMALRLSIGAERWRLVQLALAESAWLVCLAAAAGSLLSWWSAPLIVSMVDSPDNPARLLLPLDWRVAAFSVGLVLLATGLFGVMPALVASGVKPLQVLKGGYDAGARHRTTHVLVALQVAFCALVLLGAGLFIATFDRLSKQPTGFSDDRLLLVDAVARRAQPAFWDQVAKQLAIIPGVERVAMVCWPLLSGNVWSAFVSIDNEPQEVKPYFLTVSPGWAEVLKIPFIAGRDFLRPTDTYPGVAIVNQAFAKQYFGGENPVGRSFGETPSRGDALPKEAAGVRFRVRIVGLVGDARYRTLRESVVPTVYVPFRSVDDEGVLQPLGWGTFLVRTSQPDPMSLAPIVRQEVPRARPEFRVSSIRTQTSLNQSHAGRERLLAGLALFFAGVAVLLAGIGLYGVIHHAVVRRRQEIGIRITLGCSAVHIAHQVTMDIFVMVMVGSVAALVAGLASVQYVETLLYEVKTTDPAMLVPPLVIMLMVAVLAAMAPVIAAVRTDPAGVLRAE